MDDEGAVILLEVAAQLGIVLHSSGLVEHSALSDAYCSREACIHTCSFLLRRLGAGMATAPNGWSAVRIFKLGSTDVAAVIYCPAFALP